MAELPGVTGRDGGAEQGGRATWTGGGREPGAGTAHRRDNGINVSTATPFAARLDMEARGLEGLVRASVHYFNTEEEIAMLVETVASLH